MFGGAKFGIGTDLKEGVGCRVLPILRGSITQFSGKKYLNFPPDHSHIWYFLIDKKSKSLTQQGF
ncbi:hypothetical protein B1L04_12855 [Microcystis aeruginosa KW]|jgi:hypothetical protein|uniref:Uncharacterized protein n=2 Tax=Microcystis aeruginosa TaxID=1126 RepID=B0JH15_MICAN|nr:hypothetical protein [Microcystis aeruginosa]OPF16989.1 hypothetical protein B1L04_12855 [Microcystis aeruginosa KW]BAG02167.1 unknown protein [Microcystis aeruginosa NIES-843]